MNMFLNHSKIDTPSPEKKWLNYNQEERISKVQSALKEADQFKGVTVVDSHVNGEIYLALEILLPSSQRGTLLLDLEQFLKSKIDDAITVWLEPLGDKSTLRNLRGITVKVRRDDYKISVKKDQHND